MTRIERTMVGTPFPSPDGRYEALEVLGLSFFDKHFSAWIREAGEEGPGTQLSGWTSSGVGLEWSGPRDLSISHSRGSRRTWIANEWRDVRIRERR